MAVNNKPKIAVTGPNRSGLTAWLFTALNVRLAGGVPIRVTPDDFSGQIDFDGIIIGGGSDIHPDNYIKQALPKVERSLWLKIKEALVYPMELLSRFSTSEYDKARDSMEQEFIDYAMEQDKPILGICRGHQLLNAELGGSMYQSTLPLLQEKMRIRSPFPRKKVIYTKDNTLINDIVGDDPIRVNAIHSQAIAQPAESLEVTAKEKAGINQVIESKNSDNVLGVQWHPEYLFYMKTHRSIFQWLVQQAKNRKGQKEGDNE
ncbi:gamma-glutamyl-gamma-aminobutyrate hydrolase family protein [Aliiglaciecola sp. 3_MG-2023]|uniref:gamma-glutamyl-gamma-aminobutyrate hydrolase family protein n=1 Tax=Aliiglaciecola sp. 3_MG-2023 TaxID=3062644 RepID=UPI0026E30C5C|nr:gamma-glutamyl-gamma-aminobutyrate hydrolase family protein [Aliiglaciecola sp. 3_MG-2023]MDO6692694.1 gamma-glutamyl-gamma-aminobutyrate hydrolase family protein [Aliiglaciecola sp. 3_MG-2023]